MRVLLTKLGTFWLNKYCKGNCIKFPLFFFRKNLVFCEYIWYTIAQKKEGEGTLWKSQQ